MCGKVDTNAISGPCGNLEICPPVLPAIRKPGMFITQEYSEVCRVKMQTTQLPLMMPQKQKKGRDHASRHKQSKVQG